MTDFLLLLLIALAVWWAFRTLRKTGGHGCSQCRQSCGSCCSASQCKHKNTR